MIKFGWRDEIGNTYFPKDFHPDPVFDENGDGWISINMLEKGIPIEDEWFWKIDNKIIFAFVQFKWGFQNPNLSK